MALNTNQTRELEEISTEIAQLVHRLTVSNGLGDNHSSGGISTSFANNLEWQKRLTLLRKRRNQLEGIRDGTALPMSAELGITVVNFLG